MFNLSLVVATNLSSACCISPTGGYLSVKIVTSARSRVKPSLPALIFINNNLIPIQNLVIGVIIAIIEFIITKDFKVSIAVSGLLAGGTYDIVHNLNKIKGE